MKISDPEAFEIARAANTDPYGSAIIRFAVRWAEEIEARMAVGKELAEVAADAMRAADTERISGSMLWCAVSTLSYWWEHGEELQRWNSGKPEEIKA